MLYYLQTVNNLTYKINIHENSVTAFGAVLDGRDTFFKIDVAALDASRSQGGVCPVLFCESCDMTGCAGYYINAEITESVITWDFFYERFYDPESPNEYKTEEMLLYSDYNDKRNDFTVHAPLTFNKADYNTLVDKLIAELPKYPYEAEEYERALKRYKSGDRFRG